MTVANDLSSNRPDNRFASRRSFLWLSGAAIAAGSNLLTWVGRAYPAGTGKTVRLGVVGGNFGAGFWFHEHPDCVVTGVTDLIPERREALRTRYRCDKAYDSLETMIREARDIDAVAIFSGAPDHTRHTRLCMERGWHVVCACPPCLTLEEAAVLKEVKERTGLKYMLAESSYYQQECLFARNLYKAGGFGELFYCENEYYHDLREQYFEGGDFNKPVEYDRVYDTPFERERNKSGHSWRWGYAPMLYPTHSLAYLVGVTKERVTKVSCLGWTGSQRAAQESLLSH